jgi:putative Holliday junction resolvase
VHRILALDIGRRRIGLAVTDALGSMVHGLDTLQRKSVKADLTRLTQIAKERKSELILAGLPLYRSGDESPMSAEIRTFGAKLSEAAGLDVVYFDERFTSVEAEARLQERGWSLKRLLEEKKKGAVDRMAAMLLLEDYLRHREEGERRTSE